MANKKLESSSDELVQIIIDALHEKKANDIVSLDLRNIKDTVANFFVIAHGDSNTQVNALHHSVVHFAKDTGHQPYKVEGTENGEWIIVDFVDVVVHIFHRDKRDFYQLEELWNDAKSKKHTAQAAKVAAEKTGKGKRVSVKKTATVKKADKIDFALEEKLFADKEATKKATAKINTAKKIAAKKLVASDLKKKSGDTKGTTKKVSTKAAPKAATKAPVAKKSAKK